MSSPLTKQDEHKLVQDCLSHNRMAQNKLYRMFSPQLMGVCMRYSNSRSEAEDMLQEGFFQIFRDLSKFKATGPLGGWMRRVMINACLQQIRKKKNLYNLVSLDMVQEEVSGPEEIYSKLGRQELLLLIQKLPAGARAVFNLYVIDAMGHKEIAETLSISTGTSKSQLSRAKTLLRDMMGNLEQTRRIKKI